MGLDVTYKGSQIAQLTEDGNLTLETAGKYCEGDIELAYSGGGDQNPVAPDNDVIFIDFDSTIRYSYSASEFLALNALPPNPTHSGLAAQGWNWDLTDAKAHVSKYGDLIAVQLYYTSDGKTKVYFTIPQGTKGIYCGMNVDGEVEIDWGDGSEKTTVIGSDLSTNIYTPHTYTPGDYVLTVDVIAGHAKFAYADYWQSLILSERLGSKSAYFLNSCINKIELGSAFLFNPYAIRGLINLNYATIPPSLTGLTELNGLYESKIKCFGNKKGELWQLPNGLFRFANLKYVCLRNVSALSSYAFSATNSLLKVCIDGDITEIPDQAFSSSLALTKILIPETVTQIGASAFYRAGALRDIYFKSQTPPVLATQYSLAVDAPSCTIHVPAGCLEAYKTATNYPTAANYTYVEDE